MSFFIEYIKNRKEIGSVTADSLHCVRSMLEPVDFSRAGLIIEYGGGTGTVTREILNNMERDARLISIEKNPRFFQQKLACINRGQLQTYHLDVFMCGHLFQDLGLSNRFADCIISTLPCSNIDCHSLIRDHVLPYLKQDALFIQYMHIPSLLKGFRLSPILNHHFPSVTRKTVWRNLPPAFVYVCRK